MAAAELPAAEPNPFSFHEFVRTKARSGDGAPARRAEESALLSPRSVSPPQAPRPGPRLGASLLLLGPAAPGGAEDEDEDEEEWSGSYRPAAAERAHLGSPFCEGEGPGAAPRRRSYEELKAENAALRSRVRELQEFSESQADMMRKLERKLEENKIKEEKEAQDLEAMVQHVEQNLQLMTKRAVKAENNATKLKQENALLQVQLKNYKMENEALRSGQSASLAVVKRNADTALQNLLAVITSSQSSIKQLVSGAESLQLVADLLKSIDRISEVAEDGQ
ncbi:serologically defined colon cancer antigen 3 [Numida meleagris]|uniref:serologically defined colon cancer antigen 3 n=1 Tax=Numida meleagris TaxID=8996 RepID=UPI000B3E2EB0|nr:serologically defined colon cancer antigen 3 [Numida meleagris]